jgi:hypothetical protein
MQTQTATLEVLDRQETPPNWKCLLFMKDGRSHLGFHIHPSLEAATEAIAAGEVVLTLLLIKCENYRIVEKGTRRHLYYCRDYSHAIPIPVMP